MPENGCLGNFVITEEDYVDFLTRMTTRTAIPAQFYRWFRERSFLFLRLQPARLEPARRLEGLTKYLEAGRSPSWSIQLRPSELDCRVWAAKERQDLRRESGRFRRQIRRKMNA